MTWTSEEPEPTGPEPDEDEGFETEPAIESDDPPPEEGFDTEPVIKAPPPKEDSRDE
jgi:hypothetical protein